MNYLGIDIGGSWIKGAMVHDLYYKTDPKNGFNDVETQAIKNTLDARSTPNELLILLKKLITQFQLKGEAITGLGISTAGIINYHGTKVLKAVEYLHVLESEDWKHEIESEMDCLVSLINDADAATIGLAESGKLKENKTIGVLPVGTGIGFAVWRNGRRWRLGKRLTLLGSIWTPTGFYNSILSASKLASRDKNEDLKSVFTKESGRELRNSYIRDLANVISTAAIIYDLDEVVVCGGLADAVTECHYPLEAELNVHLSEAKTELEKPVCAVVSDQGNDLQLIGALAIARWESVARSQQIEKKYDTISTEIPYRRDIQLQELSTSTLLRNMWEAEEEAGKNLKKSLPVIGLVIDHIVNKLKNGGRLIYVGSGTSGRIAAMDAVEIPCTYGFPEDRIISLVAGGISDASIEIESNFEEDASSVPEMLLLNINKNDSVIGISASGASYYVQSALAMAKERGAYTVLIQSDVPDNPAPYYHDLIPLNSGYEIVAGSTRMKAGTSTKKILNFISSSLMIKLGKVAGSYMIDVACINQKLIQRAQSILRILYGIDKDEAFERLNKADMRLSTVIEEIQSEQGAIDK